MNRFLASLHEFMQDLRTTIYEAIAAWKRQRWLRRQRASIPDPFTN